MTSPWRRWLSGAALVGLALGSVDAAVTLARLKRRPVSLVELARVAASALGSVALVWLVAALALALVARAVIGLRGRAQGALVTLLGALAGLIVGFALFSGTGVRRLGLQPLGVGLSVASLACGAFLAWRRRADLALWAREHARPLTLAGAVAGASLYALNATVLVKQYALAHGVAAFVVAALFSVVVSWRAGDRLGRVARVTLSLVALTSVVALSLVARSYALRSELRQRSPLAQYAVRFLGLVTREGSDAVVSMDERLVAERHLPLFGRDLVLVTIDALRADRLRALGGRGRTPAIDAIAAHGALFRRAYCTTPHTSYSLASLMMGTFARSVLALPGPSRRHGTLAGWLGDRGYATAGFYPPAVFAVDGDRFGDLRERHFDFTHRDESYANGPDRVRQVERWLDARPPHERVFVWVHLFEPHESYERHPEHPYGDSPMDRYDAECSAADDAVRDLRESFARRGRRAAWVVTADHGEEFGEHGGSFHGTSVYDEQVHVPLVIDAPGVSAHVIDAPVSLVDVVPTVLAGVGIRLPPRLRGNDLGALVFGPPAATHAFASTGTLRAVVAPEAKLILDLSDGTTELYDLARDPGETRNLADQRPAVVRELRGRIQSWEASHARIEAGPDPQNGRPATEDMLPDVLNRAIQGDRSVAPEVAGLLGAGGLGVRQRAARVLGDLGVSDATVTDALARELGSGHEPLVREAGMSLSLLGDPRGREATRRVLDASRASPLTDDALRAALGVARFDDHAAVDILGQWVNHARAPDAARDAAVAALRRLRDPASLPVWVTLLGDMRLAPEAAHALGELGDARAIEPLETSLATQRYPLSIRAILGALARLHAPDAVERVTAALGTGDPLPDVFALLRALREPGRLVAGSTTALTVRLGRALNVPLRGGRGPVGRVYVRTRATSEVTLTIAPGVEIRVAPGEREQSIDLPTRRPLPTLRMQTTGEVEVLGVMAR
jgi:arylsulfatase A-like enzyme